MTRIIVHDADRRCVAVTICTLGLLLSICLLDLRYPLAILWIPVLWYFTFANCVINHNHQHRRIFRSRALNKIFDLLLTLAKGHSATTVVVPHNANHHRFSGSPGDWIIVDLAGSGPGILRLLRYIWRASLAMARQRRMPDAPRLSAVRGRQLRVERLVLILWVGCLLWLNPRVTTYSILPAWGLSMLSLVGVNLLQHDGCDPFSKYNHSRNFVSRVGNWLLFNNGYHSIHHTHPSMHWSLLREAHLREIAPRIDPSLIEGSVLNFLFTRYLFSWSGSPPPRVYNHGSRVLGV